MIFQFRITKRVANVSAGNLVPLANELFSTHELSKSVRSYQGKHRIRNPSCFVFFQLLLLLFLKLILQQMGNSMIRPGHGIIR